ncbi:MAG: hypothetical protein QOE06_3465 [Thermoleophilaceae bacterium]|nr:hypothetical protein [Thermoleophilaceae bacterium]
MADNGVQPGGPADKQLGAIVGEVTQKAQLLVREEIALAKAEITVKTSRIVKAVVFFSAAAFFALLMLIFLLHMLSFGFVDWFSLKVWVGYAITTVLLLVLTGIAGFVGVRLFKKGSPPTPDYAIEEAQKTKVALEEARR